MVKFCRGCAVTCTVLGCRVQTTEGAGAWAHVAPVWSAAASTCFHLGRVGARSARAPSGGARLVTRALIVFLLIN